MEFCLECTHVPALGDGVVSLAPQGKVGGGGGGYGCLRETLSWWC